MMECFYGTVCWWCAMWCSGGGVLCDWWWYHVVQCSTLRYNGNVLCCVVLCSTMTVFAVGCGVCSDAMAMVVLLAMIVELW